MLGLFWQRLDQGARAALPFALVLVLVLVGGITWPLPYFGEVAPSLGMVGIYYWALYRPDLFRPSMAFGLGLLNDVIHFLPLGLSALVFVAAHQLVLSQRRYFVGHSFFMLWFGFGLTMLLAMAATWGLESLYRWQFLPLMPVVLQMVMAIILFPLPAWALIRIQRSALSHN